MEKHWFTLYPNTFLWIKGENGLIYNALNHLSYAFKMTGSVEKWCNELLRLENLYTISVSGEDIMDDQAKQWFQSVIAIKGGYLSSVAETEKRPVSLKPVLKLHERIDAFQWEHSRGTGGEIIRNLHALTFYLNGSEEYGSDTYYHQTVFPLKSCGQLDVKKIVTFARYCRNPSLKRIHLVGAIFKYPEYQALMDGLTELCLPYTIYITLQDFIQNFDRIAKTQWPEYNQFRILVDTIPDQLPPLHGIKVQIRVNALVFSETDCSEVSRKFDDLPIYCDTQVIPMYNGENREFFKSNVFTDRDDLDSVTLTKREIFMRQALNVHNFGKLTVLPDGTVYANVNHEPLGTMDDSVYSLVYKEFTEGQSWLQIRDKAPCTDCVYQWLCPSPSNYETVIGQPNLCHVNH